MTKFQYKVTGEISNKLLQDLGQNGWELVAVHPTKLYFKKELFDVPEEAQPTGDQNAQNEDNIPD